MEEKTENILPGLKYVVERGVTPAQAKILLALIQHGRMTSLQISEITGTINLTVRSHILKMRDRGLIEFVDKTDNGNYIWDIVR